MTAPSRHAPHRSTDGPGPDVVTLIDSLLAEQRDASAVEQFARRHDAGSLPAGGRHRHLIPLTTPRPGEQYAFEVDLDRCSGCKACVTACHSLNGLDEGESWRSVGLLVDSPPRRADPVQVTVTTACHHCLEPACLLGCPVLAYDKDPSTGIVRHLDDQCIGCSYCILMCPYEVPRFSARRGIVRKCDLCHGRLAEGEAPACAQACPNEAIRIGLVPTTWQPITLGRKAPPRSGATPEPAWWPDAPDPEITQPTTRYRTRRDPSALEAADAVDARPAAVHWPLVLMLVLTQAGAGALAGLHPWPEAGGPWGPWAAAALVLAGLAASGLHLGQPLKAWRVWMGWRTSWLSREALVLPVLAGTSGILATALARPDLLPPGTIPWIAGLHLTALAAALVAQSMVYIDTRRAAWRPAATIPRFLGTSLLAGVATAQAAAPGPVPAALLAAVVVARLAHEAWSLRAPAGGDATPARQRTARLVAGPLAWAVRTRLLLAAAGCLLLVATGSGAAAAAGLLLLLLAEVAERRIFFTSMSPDRMPGLP